jgi:hypothetical protein
MSTTETLERREPETIPQRGSGPYGSIVIGALLVVVGGLWLLDVVGAVALEAAIVLPAILAVIGLGLIFGAWNGPHPGLVVAGVFVTIAVLAVAAAPPDAFHGGIGDRGIVLTDQADLAATYDVGVGGLRLDLSELTMTEAANVDVTIGAGDLTVVLPPEIPVDVSASVGAGQIDLLGEVSEGLSVSRTYTSEGFEAADVTLTLDLDIAAGNMEVDR